MEYFDLHCHILPGVDDGAQTIEESMEMIDLSYKEGTRSILFTPHYVRGHNQYTKESLDETFSDFKNQVKEKYPDFNLYLGNEILYEEGIVDDLKAGNIHTLNHTKYVLVEFNIKNSYSQIYDAIRKLTNARFRPIIAHVERYLALYKRMDRIEELLDMETLLQMNISSVYGGMFDENARWCKKLVKEGYISFFGTDAHDLAERAPIINDYVGWIEKKCGIDYLEEAFLTNAQKVTRNQYINE